jgi:hypothetical protein
MSLLYINSRYNLTCAGTVYQDAFRLSRKSPKDGDILIILLYQMGYALAVYLTPILAWSNMIFGSPSILGPLLCNY